MYKEETSCSGLVKCPRCHKRILPVTEYENHFVPKSISFVLCPLLPCLLPCLCPKYKVARKYCPNCNYNFCGGVPQEKEKSVSYKLIKVSMTVAPKVHATTVPKCDEKPKSSVKSFLSKKSSKSINEKAPKKKPSKKELSSNKSKSSKDTIKSSSKSSKRKKRSKTKICKEVDVRPSKTSVSTSVKFDVKNKKLRKKKMKNKRKCECDSNLSSTTISSKSTTSKRNKKFAKNKSTQICVLNCPKKRSPSLFRRKRAKASSVSVSDTSRSTSVKKRPSREEPCKLSKSESPIFIKCPNSSELQMKESSSKSTFTKKSSSETKAQKKSKCSFGRSKSSETKSKMCWPYPTCEPKTQKRGKFLAIFKRKSVKCIETGIQPENDLAVCYSVETRTSGLEECACSTTSLRKKQKKELCKQNLAKNSSSSIGSKEKLKKIITKIPVMGSLERNQKQVKTKKLLQKRSPCSPKKSKTRVCKAPCSSSSNSKYGLKSRPKPKKCKSPKSSTSNIPKLAKKKANKKPSKKHSSKGSIKLGKVDACNKNTCKAVKKCSCSISLVDDSKIFQRRKPYKKCSCEECVKRMLSKSD